MQKSKHNLKYIIFDFFAATIAWTLFYIFRKIRIENVPINLDYKFYFALATIPFLVVSSFA